MSSLAAPRGPVSEVACPQHAQILVLLQSASAPVSVTIDEVPTASNAAAQRLDAKTVTPREMPTTLELTPVIGEKNVFVSVRDATRGNEDAKAVPDALDGYIGCGEWQARIAVGEPTTFLLKRTTPRGPRVADAPATSEPPAPAGTTPPAPSPHAITAGSVQRTVERTVDSGADVVLVRHTSWDGACNPRDVTITVTQPPANGTVSVVAGLNRASLNPTFGSAGRCGGTLIMGKRVVYRSEPGFHGSDYVVIHRVSGAHRIIETQVIITVR
jgi:hypothetical protein